MTNHRVAAAALPLVFLFVVLLGSPERVAAQSAAERAAQVNAEGKKLWKDKNDLVGAVEKFRQATVLSPEGRYYFNLCYALHQLGRYREALTACRAVEANGADADVLAKTAVGVEDLEKRVPPDTGAGQGGQGQGGQGQGGQGEGGYGEGQGEGGYGEGGYGEGQGEGGYGEGGYGEEYPPDQGQGYPPPGPLAGLEKTGPPTDEYNWSLGAELGFAAASVGRADYYASSAATLKLNASFMLPSRRNIGVQGYLGVTQLASGDMADSTLSIVDVGGALFMHLRRERFYLTPLAGLQLAVMQPDDSLSEVPATLGLRGELAFSWIVGPMRNHVISVTPGLNLYAAASSADAGLYGLDEPSMTVGVTVGYTLRFMEPFGVGPIFVLE